MPSIFYIFEREPGMRASFGFETPSGAKRTAVCVHAVRAVRTQTFPDRSLTLENGCYDSASQARERRRFCTAGSTGRGGGGLEGYFERLELDLAFASS